MRWTASRRSRAARVRGGALGLLLAYSAGPSILRVLAEDPKITAPILLHVSPSARAARRL